MRQLIRGERAKLSELAAINHIWEVGIALDAPFYIADFCCLGLDARGEVNDDRFLISYNQPDAPGDAIRLDNAGNGEAIFTLNLGRLPREISRLVFTITLQQAEMPGGLLGAAFSALGAINTEIGQGHITLRTPAVECAFFPFSGDDFAESATLILGEFYWRDEWRFVAAGQPLRGELSAFLQTLTEGPLPIPLAPPAPRPAPPLAAPPRSAPPLAVPPRPSSPPLAPSRPPLAPSLQPSAPVAARVAASPRAPVAPPRAAPVPAAPRSAPVASPAVQAAARPLVVAPAAAQSPVAAPLPQSLPPGEKLQDLIDAAAPASTLRLMRDEYQGPVVIAKPLVLEGGEGALWAKSGPVLTISAPDVTLRHLDIEVTGRGDAAGDAGVALHVAATALRLRLDDVQVRGRTRGLGAEDGEWQLPATLDLGEFAARAANDFRFRVRVPVAVELTSAVEGVALSPAQIEAGEHQITLQVRDVAPETLLVGYLEVRSAQLTRAVALRGAAVAGQAPKLGVELEAR
ncbi:MAG TPA: TerD family protein [Abditibacterium sp.]